MNGAIRFGFFVAVVLAIGLGVYANTLKHDAARQSAAAAAVAVDRDGWKAKFDQQSAKSTQDASALAQAQSQIKDLQAQLEEAKKPPPPRPRGRR